MKLIVGLGNPGTGYANNRHNLGFMCVSHFARAHGIQFDKKQGKARFGMGEVDGIKVVVARPQTFMNLSGQAVSPLVRKFDIKPEDLIVIHDDLDLHVGKIRIRLGGSAGGHKGVKSIYVELGSQDFYRIRVGIGRPNRTEDLDENDAAIIDYVLSDFTPEERQTINEVIPRVSAAILCLLTEGPTAAMNKYN
ncbi:MAG: aminoacyl-tRNA hydrolase [Chloroflexi bacterium]|nr:aminoacyl-tRNA hydrolase [Chloroflexota bacterium]